MSVSGTFHPNFSMFLSPIPSPSTLGEWAIDASLVFTLLFTFLGKSFTVELSFGNNTYRQCNGHKHVCARTHTHTQVTIHYAHTQLCDTDKRLTLQKVIWRTSWWRFSHTDTHTHTHTHTHTPFIGIIDCWLLVLSMRLHKAAAGPLLAKVPHRCKAHVFNCSSGSHKRTVLFVVSRLCSKRCVFSSDWCIVKAAGL